MSYAVQLDSNSARFVCLATGPPSTHFYQWNTGEYKVILYRRLCPLMVNENYEMCVCVCVRVCVHVCVCVCVVWAGIVLIAHQSDLLL